MATLHGEDSSETFVIPVASGSGDAGTAVQLDCPNTNGSGPALTECDRSQDNIHFIAEGKNADAIFDALGTKTVSATIECNGIDFTDGGYGGSSQSCER